MTSFNAGENEFASLLKRRESEVLFGIFLLFIFRSIATWVKFFNAAGIPPPLNASYASLFVKNRMALDMLPELNKEYLREV